MKRTIEARLLEWKDSAGRKPLIVRGARQVGKTHSVMDFGRRCFSRVAAIDLERDAPLRRIFDGSIGADSVVPLIEAATGEPLGGGETLLFIDEIQAAPRAISALRYLYEERPDIPVIAAGSALEFALGDVSFPVGRVSFLWMRPMTFAEFLRATGSELLADRLPKLGARYQGSQVVHDKTIDELRKYLIVGGMPGAVNAYVQTGSFEAASEVQSDLAVSLAQSLSRYRIRIDPDSIDHVFRRLPAGVGAQLKYARLDPDRRVEKTKASASVLARALLVHMIHAADGHGLPLGSSASDKRFKPLFLDVGLLQNMLGGNSFAFLSGADIGDYHRGVVAEQFIGQEMLAAGGSENDTLYYWSRADRRGNAEVDYLLARGGRIYPVEVKSGPSGHMRSAHQYLVEHPDCPYAIAFSPSAWEKRLDGQILYVPIYTQFDDSGVIES